MTLSSGTLPVNRSCTHCRLTPCVRETCRRFGVLPDIMICIVAVLSSISVRFTDLPRIACHNIRAGNPTTRNARSAATISASGVECDTQVCFLEIAESGKNEFGPTRARYTPDVDLIVTLHPAKSASEYSASLRSLAGSQICPSRT